ncbi:hypothetical protein [Methanocalculus alkaliphilus]
MHDRVTHQAVILNMNGKSFRRAQVAKY